MDSRRLLTAILLSFIIWIILVKFFPMTPPPETTPPATTAPTTTGVAATTQETSAGISLVGDKTPNDNITLGSTDKSTGYRMRAVFTNEGASLASLRLSEFLESLTDSKSGYGLIEPVTYASDGTQYSLTTEKLTLRDDQGRTFVVDLRNARWFHSVESAGETARVRFWIDIQHEGKPLARLTKAFGLKKNSYDVAMDITLENQSGQPLEAVVRQEGTIGIRKEDPQREDRKIYAGTMVSGREGVQIDGVVRDALLKAPDRTQRIGAVDEQPVWAGETNKYFVAILSAVDPSGKLSGQWIESVNARTFSVEPLLGQDLTTVWVTKPIKLPPAKPVTLDFSLYAGPKDAHVFSQPPYASRNFNGIFSAESSWCTMQWLADLMAWILNKLYLVTRNYGLAIIALVIIVRVILHPVSKSSMVNMTKMQRDMQRLQPKMNALKEKYKNNREALNKATMELYKQEGINPAGQMLGCLPMMLQLPIWVALWSAINNTFALRLQPFFLWIKDLSGPDALITFSNPNGYTIPLLGGLMGPIHGLNVLPLLLIVSMLVQQKFSPQQAPSPDADPAQQRQQKFILYFMSVFMGLIFYNAPSGLNLYILTSTFLGVFENKLIRRHLDQEQKNPPAKKTGPSRWERFQKKMESLAKEYELDKSKRKKK